MASANITRDDATARSAAVTAEAYRVTLDLSEAEVPDQRTFRSTTEIDFTAHGGATYVDLIASEIHSAHLDGEPCDTSHFDGYRLPLPQLTQGRHTLIVDATCLYSRSGEGLHRFVDPADNRVYLYSQFEAADARRAFADFEQPDQKATFNFQMTAPSHWTIFSNSVTPTPERVSDELSRWTFAATPRMSTYVSAIVAGPYHVTSSEIHTAKGTIPASVACRQSLADFLDADAILTTTQRGFEVYEDAFQVPYAYDSYDQIFVPEFNAGAMENIGCVTFRDEYLWRHRVTSREIESRNNTILHELAHMWFGNLVTMRWWDDLWLNESFAEWAATFSADRIAQRYESEVKPWASFANERKAWAYYQDQLSSTHPIAADMSDLEKVEQNFDGITYAKGASVLKLLVSFVGQEDFLRGVHNYFTKHAYSNTELRDLLTELEAACGKDLSWFSGEWLETAGVNTLRADFDVDSEGRFTRFDVVQEGTAQHPTLRTHRLGIGIFGVTDGKLTRRNYVEVDIQGERTSVEDLIGQPREEVIILNDGDLTYAKVRFDADSARALVEHIETLDDALARAIAFASFWDATRDGELPPQLYVQLALRGVPTEHDMAAATTILSNAVTATTTYMAPELRPAANATLVQGLARLLKHMPAGSDQQLIVVKTLIAAAKSPAAAELIGGWLRDEEVPEGLDIDTGLRWQIINALARLGVIGEDEVSAELERDATSAGIEKAAGAFAALPKPRAKQEAWHRATVDPDVPNETHRQICMNFWQHDQQHVLEPYIEQFFEMLQALVSRSGVWQHRGFAAVSAVLRWLFPSPMIDETLVARVEEWLRHNQDHEQVRRAIGERIDDARRALRCQEASRAAGQSTENSAKV